MMIPLTTAIVLAIVFACMFTIIVFTVKGNLRLQRELHVAEMNLSNAQLTIDNLNTRYVEAVSESSWLRGLRTGQKRATVETAKEDDLK